MEFTQTFFTVFIAATILTSPILIFLSLAITTFGQIVGHLEKWKKFDALYWSFITATTVGYGDIRPLKKISRVFSVLIAIVGIMFTGIIVAITLKATNIAFEKHVNPTAIETIKEQIE